MAEGSPEVKLDRDLQPSQIQALSSREAVAGFFAWLGYNTNARLQQTPSNLGISADSIVRQIKHVELLADQEGALQVYLFEVSSVTIALERALTRSLTRNRVTNFLLVITSDYERIDFLLAERVSPIEKATPRGLTPEVAGVRPRILTIERHNPERVQLRVLRRFTYTESDAYAQYDKLRSAYGVAEWSEEHFNNRALFSGYYLRERLPSDEIGVWKEDCTAAYRALKKLYEKASPKWAGKSEETLREALLIPVFQSLGFTPVKLKTAASDQAQPDFQLLAQKSDKQPLTVALTYCWDRSLDGKDATRDAETPEENPSFVVVSLLEQGIADWVIVTNGKLWRLYSTKAHAKATNYYELDLEEVLAQHVPHEAFRFFWVMFRRQAFEPWDGPAAVGMAQPGKPRTFLDGLLAGSEAYAKRLGERLKDRIFEEIFPHLAAGFVEDWKRRNDGALPDQSVLDDIYHGTLTFLYRLLFLLYAESRDLLPVREYHGYYQACLTRLKMEIAKITRDDTEKREERIKENYSATNCDLYDRLMALFKVVDQGSRELNVPVYNGGLFLTEVAEDDLSPEARNAQFLLNHRVPDRHLAVGLDLLARDEDEKTFNLMAIDYKSLGVRQLGSIYEGLLEFTLRIATEKMAVIKGKKSEEIVPHKEAVQKKLKIVKVGRGKDAQEKTYPKGHLYLENDKHERRATGSYYTPDYIVKYIVEHAVGPVLEEKLDAVRPALRDAQKKHDDAVKRHEAFRKQGMKAPPAEQLDLIGKDVVDALFNVRVLDPAMGSGHFMVEAVDFITNRMIQFLEGFPWNPVVVYLEKMRQTILESMEKQGITVNPQRLDNTNLLKRHVLKRCIYGVDLNPMAVELAKVSLWLDCFTLGAPLSFLDHHLKCGNSLIGAVNVETHVARTSTKYGDFILAVGKLLELGRLSDSTADEVMRSRVLYGEATGLLVPFRNLLNIHVARFFVSISERMINRAIACAYISPPSAQELEETEHRAWDAFVLAQGEAVKRKFFHWELEFPEVFYGPRHGSVSVFDRREDAGFDAVIGNPPYDVLAEKELGYDLSHEQAYFAAMTSFAPALRGKNNLYKLFICRGVNVTAASGALSFIVPMTLLGDDQSAGVRKHLLEHTLLSAIEAFPQKDDQLKRVFPEAKLATCVFVTRRKIGAERFSVRTHPAQFMEESSPTLRIATEELIRFDPENLTIPTCTQHDWDIAARIISNGKVQRLGQCCCAYQGEVNETADGKRGFVSAHATDGPQILRGSTICLYVVREASQGEPIYLKTRKYLAGKPNSEKAKHHEQPRVGWQESSPQNNFRRIIAASVAKGAFCNHLINYIPESDSTLDLDLLLCLLNSRILDWYFRLGSTNAHVSHYQIHNLFVPTVMQRSTLQGWQTLLRQCRWAELRRALTSCCDEPGIMPQSVAAALAELSRRIQEIEGKRVLANRSERSRLAPESQQIQDVIDAVLFHCYGLTDEDAKYITSRLSEML
jgi:hypothetical protein